MHVLVQPGLAINASGTAGRAYSCADLYVLKVGCGERWGYVQHLAKWPSLRVTHAKAACDFASFQPSVRWPEQGPSQMPRRQSTSCSYGSSVAIRLASLRAEVAVTELCRLGMIVLRQ